MIRPWITDEKAADSDEMVTLTALRFRFVYIMGTAMILSFQAQLRRNTPKINMFWKIVRRSFTLFLLGLLINSDGNDGNGDAFHCWLCYSRMIIMVMPAIVGYMSW